MHINFTALTEKANTIYAATQDIIDTQEVGNRKTTKEIVELVVAKTGLPVSMTTGLVALYLDNNEEIDVRAGRNGGAYKIIPPAASSSVSLEKCDSCGNMKANEIKEVE